MQTCARDEHMAFIFTVLSLPLLLALVLPDLCLQRGDSDFVVVVIVSDLVRRPHLGLGGQQGGPPVLSDVGKLNVPTAAAAPPFVIAGLVYGHETRGCDGKVMEEEDEGWTGKRQVLRSCHCFV